MTPTNAVPLAPAEPPRDLHRLVVPSLFASVLLCFPVGAVLALLALVGIKRSKGAKGGVVLAGVAFFLSGVLVPAVLLSSFYGSPRVLDSCYYTQEEAVGILRVISYSQENFREREGRYGSLDEIGWSPQVKLGPYDFTLERFGKDTFLASGKGKDHMDGDLLTVDESRKVARARDICVLSRN